MTSALVECMCLAFLDSSGEFLCYRRFQPWLMNFAESSAFTVGDFVCKSLVK